MTPAPVTLTYGDFTRLSWWHRDRLRMRRMREVTAAQQAHLETYPRPDNEVTAANDAHADTCPECGTHDTPPRDVLQRHDGGTVETYTCGCGARWMTTWIGGHQ